MKLTKAQIEQIPDLVRTGKLQAHIADHLGCSVRTVQYWIERWKKAGQKGLNAKRGRRPLNLK